MGRNIDTVIIIGTVVAIAVLSSLKRKKPNKDDNDTKTGWISPVDQPDVPSPALGGMWIPPGEGEPPRPLLAGDPTNPEIVGTLNEMDAFLAENGVDLSTVSAAELTTMSSAPAQPSGKKPVAIPPRELWPNIVPTLRLWQQNIRGPIGVPMSVHGYRPPDYNEAVGGTPGSTHQWFAAIDITLVGDGNTDDNRALLGEYSARVYVNAPSSDRVGFGAYGQPFPRHVHLDTRYKHRRWEDAQYYIDNVEAAIS